MLFIEGVINLAAELVENGELVTTAVNKALYQISDHSDKGKTEIAGEVSKGLFMKQKHDPYVKDWDAYLSLSPNKKLALLVKRAVKRRATMNSLRGSENT